MVPHAYRVISSWKLGGEFGGARDRAVDVGVAEHVAAHRHAGVVYGIARRDVADDEAGDPVGCFGGREVTDTVDHDQPTVLDPRSDARQGFRRCRDILGTADRQHRSGDLGESIGDVEVRQRLARLGIGFVVGTAQRIE